MAALINDKSVQKISQELVATGHIIGMVFFPVQGIYLILGHFKIHQLHDLNDIGILEGKCDTELFQYVVIGHHFFPASFMPFSSIVMSLCLYNAPTAFLNVFLLTENIL